MVSTASDGCVNPCVALAISIVVMLASCGCGSDSNNTPDLTVPPLRQDLASDLVFRINGADPSTEIVQIRNQTQCLVRVSFHAPTESLAAWDEVCMVLLKEESQAKPTRIERLIPVGTKQDHCGPLSDKISRFESRVSRGKDGLIFQTRSNPGTYDVILCLRKYPATIAETKRSEEAPFTYLHPIRVGRVTIID